MIYSDEEEDDDDDDEMELQAELERIKAERMTLQAKKELEERELDEKTKRDSALKGNPLLNLDGNAESAKVCNNEISIWSFLRCII